MANDGPRTATPVEVLVFERAVLRVMQLGDLTRAEATDAVLEAIAQSPTDWLATVNAVAQNRDQVPA